MAVVPTTTVYRGLKAFSNARNHPRSLILGLVARGPSGPYWTSTAFLNAGGKRVDEVEDYYLEMHELDSEATHVLLCMSRAEWQAFRDDPGFDDLAKWRYEGWPNTCSLCGKEIVVEQYEWVAASGPPDSADPDPSMFHVACIPDLARRFKAQKGREPRR